MPTDLHTFRLAIHSSWDVTTPAPGLVVLTREDDLGDLWALVVYFDHRGEQTRAAVLSRHLAEQVGTCHAVEVGNWADALQLAGLQAHETPDPHRLSW